jgi:hypothetical protein
MRRNNFFGFRSARTLGVIPFPFVPWGNSRRKGLRRLAGVRFNFFFMGSRRFVRTCDFTFRKRRTLVVFGNDSLFFDFSILRKRRKRSHSRMVLQKIATKEKLEKYQYNEMQGKFGIRQKLEKTKYLGKRIGSTVWFHSTGGGNRILLA